MIKTFLLAFVFCLISSAAFTTLMLIGTPKPYSSSHIIKYSIVGGIIGLISFIVSNGKRLSKGKGTNR